MNKIIDCRMLNCPEPLLRTKEALALEPEEILTIVDNEAARQNVSRFAKKQGYSITWEEKENAYHIIMKKLENGHRATQDEENSVECAVAPPQALTDTIIMVGSDQLGRGSEELGSLLMRNYIYTLTKRDQLPRALIFLNSGVKLCVEESAVLEELRLLESGGVEILACGTCLDYFKFKDSLRVGAVSNIYDIADLLSTAPVVTL